MNESLEHPDAYPAVPSETVYLEGESHYGDFAHSFALSTERDELQRQLALRELFDSNPT